MKNIFELTEQEQCIIQDALNEYFNNAVNKLEDKNIGDIEKKILAQRSELTKPLIFKFENVY